MGKATGKDHSEINLAIWGDDDWLDLTPPAQHLYFVLWTSPQLSYCGSGEWHSGRIAAMANGWTAKAVEVAAAELSRELFVIIDTSTEEFLLRSWIKHDALWRKPNMAVSMANARAALASRTLRGVVVHEVQKIKDRNVAEAKASSEVIESAGWQRDAVKEMLKQKAVDPTTVEPFTPAPTPPLAPGPTPWLTVSAGDGVNPPPTPSPTPTPYSHSSKDDDTALEPPEDPYAEVVVVPEYVDSPSRPQAATPTSAAKTVVRQVLGNAYPKTMVDRLANQVSKLYREGHPDSLIREALAEWERRPGCGKPEFLPTVLGDLVKAQRAVPGHNGRSPNKLRATHDFAQDLRAQEQAQLAPAQGALE